MGLGARGTTTPVSPVAKNMLGIVPTGRGPYTTGPRALRGPRQGRAQALGNGTGAVEPYNGRSRGEAMANGYFVPGDLDPLLPTQIPLQADRKPEHHLYLAMMLDVASVLYTAEEDHRRMAACKSKDPHHLRAKIRQIRADMEWIFGPCDPVVPFSAVCDVLGLDVDATREGLLRVVRTSPALERILAEIMENCENDRLSA